MIVWAGWRRNFGLRRARVIPPIARNIITTLQRAGATDEHNRALGHRCQQWICRFNQLGSPQPLCRRAGAGAAGGTGRRVGTGGRHVRGRLMLAVSVSLSRRERARVWRIWSVPPPCAHVPTRHLPTTFWRVATYVTVDEDELLMEYGSDCFGRDSLTWAYDPGCSSNWSPRFWLLEQRQRWGDMSGAICSRDQRGCGS